MTAIIIESRHLVVTFPEPNVSFRFEIFKPIVLLFFSNLRRNNIALKLLLLA